MTVNDKKFVETKEIQHRNQISILKHTRAIDEDKHVIQRVTRRKSVESLTKIGENQSHPDILDEKVVTKMSPEQLRRFQADWRNNFVPALSPAQAGNHLMKYLEKK